jgi:hypothetical protein
MLAAGLAIALLAAESWANIRLPAIIGDNMVLQTGGRVCLWGWADPNEEIGVKVSWHTVDWTIQADNAGKWVFQMAAPEAGGPYEITFKGKNTITVKNILAGEVWVGSGQSNMQMTVKSSANAEQEIAGATDGQIRLFTVARKIAEKPQENCEGKWVLCSRGFLGRGVLLRPGAAPGAEAADRSDSHLLGWHPGGGVDQPRRVAGESQPGADPGAVPRGSGGLSAGGGQVQGKPREMGRRSQAGEGRG